MLSGHLKIWDCKDTVFYLKTKFFGQNCLPLRPMENERIILGIDPGTQLLGFGIIRVAGFYYQATGKIAVSSWLIYGDSFLALPLCLYTLPLWFGIDGVWLAMPVSRVLLMLLLCCFWFVHLPSRKSVTCRG